jgi:hypothetical protein
MAAHPLPARREQLLRRVIQRAVLSPVSLGMTTAAAVLAADPATWIAAGTLAALNGALIFLQARSPAYVRRVADELYREQWREQIGRAENLQRMLDPGPAAVLGNIIRSQERLLTLSLEEETIAPGRAQSANLLAHCLQLAEKRVEMENFLAETRAADLEREALQLQGQVAAAHDPVARRLFEQALEQKNAEIENLRSIQHAISRIDGQLAAVDATYDNLVGKIVRLRITDAATDRVDEEHVMRELNSLAQGVAALEESLNETLAVRGAS